MTLRCSRGERTASAMESQLTSLERKIDNLLASVDDQTRDVLNASASHQTTEEASENGAETKT